jgi:NADH:ubiquinone oxidoreductase subunit 1 (chain H)
LCSFFTLFERKIIGGFHYRKGPNKVGFIGFFQPFRDALKLFRKEIGVPYLRVKFYLLESQFLLFILDYYVD